MSDAYDDAVTFLHSDALTEMMVRAATAIAPLNRAEFDAAEASIRNEYAQTAAAPREAEHYPRMPIVNADMSVTQRNAYYDESGFGCYSPQYYDHTDIRRQPDLFIRFSTPLALTLKQHYRLMRAIRDRKDWIKQTPEVRMPAAETFTVGAGIN